MGSSREESPDWLHSFQAPTHPALTLSSDSDSPPEDNPLREGKDVDSPFNGAPKVKSPSKRLKAKDPKSTKKQKINNLKKKKGNEGHEKASVEEPSDGEPNARNHSFWMLLSDSEPCPDNSYMREDYTHHEESSVRKTTQVLDKEKDVVLTENGQEPLLNEASKENSPKKRVKVDHISIKKKKANGETKEKGHDDGTELLEEETLDKHNEPQDCLWCSLTKSIDQRLLLSVKVNL